MINPPNKRQGDFMRRHCMTRSVATEKPEGQTEEKKWIAFKNKGIEIPSTLFFEEF